MRPNLINRLKEEWNNLDPVDPLRGLIADAIDALAEPAQQQEPVAVYVGETWCGSVVRLYEDLPLETPLYTSPQPGNPLTDEQIKLIMDGRGEEGDDDYVKPAFDPFGISEDDLMNFARAIEAAHGITGEKA